MPETPSDPEQTRQQPIPAGEALDRPGYPPPGYEESMAALAAAEAAAQPGDTDAALAGELAALDGGPESLEAREARLGAFVTDHFADVCPPQYLGAAVAECILYEDDFREAWGEPDLQLEAADAADPVLREAIATQIVAQAATIAENDDAIATLTDEELVQTAALERQETVVISANAAAIDRQAAANQREQTGLAQDEAQNAEAVARNTEVKPTSKTARIARQQYYWAVWKPGHTGAPQCWWLSTRDFR